MVPLKKFGICKNKSPGAVEKVETTCNRRATHGSWFLGAWWRCYDVLWCYDSWVCFYGDFNMECSHWSLILWEKNYMMIGYYIIDLDHQFTTPGWILQALLNRFSINEIWRMLAQRLPPCPKQWEGGSSGKICGQIFFPKAEQKLLAPSKHKTLHFFLGGKFRPALLWYAKGAFWYCQTSERFEKPSQETSFWINYSI